MIGWAILAVVGLGLSGLHLYLGWAFPFADWPGFYATGQAIWQGTPWYAVPLHPEGTLPNLNPPLVSLLFALFAPFSMSSAFLIWTAVGLTVYGTTLGAVARTVRWPVWQVLILVACCAAFFGGLRLGQTHLLFGAVVTSAWLLDRQGRSGAAAVLIGLATYHRALVGLVAVYWIWRRDWKAGGTWLLTTTGLYALTALLFPGELREWLQAVQGVYWYDQGLNMALLGVLARVDLTPWWPLGAGLVLAALARRLPQFTRDRAWAAVLISAMLVSPVAWIFYLLIVLGPVLAVFTEAPRRQRTALLAGFGIFCLMPVFDPWANDPSPWIAGTLGSVYAWALVLWWLAVVTPLGSTGKHSATTLLPEAVEAR